MTSAIAENERIYIMYTSVIIESEERAIVFLDGRPERWLVPGRHRVWTWGAKATVIRFHLDEAFAVLTPEMRLMVPTDEGDRLEVPHHHVALVTKDGRPHAVLSAGNYVLWTPRAQVRATLVNTQTLLAEIPEGFWPLAPPSLIKTVLVQPWERALVYVDGKLDRELSAGRYALFQDDHVVTVEVHGLRERELQIVGQEVMTADKVTLRINVMLKYRITNVVQATSSVENLHDALYAEAQIASRRLIAGNTLDVLLEQRTGVGSMLRDAIVDRAHAWGVEVIQIDLKDVVLPGEMKTLLNRVIEAEKQAIASNILRREETAATRSLANTAKLLESNPTLMRLKELEAMKEIAEKIEHLTVVTSPDRFMGALSLGDRSR